MIVISGAATAVTTKEYKRQDGSTGVLRKVSILNDAGTAVDQVTLTKGIPDPGQGEIVAYEVGVKTFMLNGRAYVDFTAYRLAPLPALGDVAPARAAG